MKIACITDQHFNCRKNSKLFHDYFLEFYNNIFFPYLKDNNIKTVIDMGDTFDTRKTIDIAAIDWAKRNYYDVLRDIGCEVHTIVGNHTAVYKSTNRINSVDLLLREYENVKVYSEPTEIRLNNLNCLFIPWINEENQDRTLSIVSNTKASVIFGHLELNGFSPYKGHIMEDGMESNIFNKFQRVFSGHFHTRSTNGKIFYIGNPYEIYYNDVDDTRGFMVFDTETLDHEYIDNPYKMHHILYYDDSEEVEYDFTNYSNKIVKLIVLKKNNPYKFEAFVDTLCKNNVAELKIVENSFYKANEDFDFSLETEDTFTILQRFVAESDCELNKDIIKSILSEVHKEASELV